MMRKRLAIVGAPSSAGAYGPGQEKAPAAVRAAGLVEQLSARGIEVADLGDVAGVRWRVDKDHPRAMNAEAVAAVAKATSDRVASALDAGDAVLVLGGDCTVELGTVAGALRTTENVGLVYVDLDTDLNTPESTTDGALDWMGIAHMLALDGTIPALTALGPKIPMLRPDQVLLFADDNIEPFERRVIEELGIAEVRLEKVAADPARAGHAVATGWARRFERLLVHVDLDVLDFVDMQLAENYRRNRGLRFDQLMAAIKPLLSAPNCVALTVCELNPEHGESETLRSFVEALAGALSAQTSPGTGPQL